MAEVKVNGIWLHSLGYVDAVKWSTQWGEGPCGSSLASCTIAVTPANDSTLLRLNTVFEVWDAGVKVFSGVLSEMGRDFPRTLSAKGWARRASDFDAVDGSGNPTTNIRTAVTQAVTDGLPWTNGTVFPSVTYGTASQSPARLDSLLNSWASSTGVRWGVDDERAAFNASDPTTPTWFLDASDLDIGVASDGLYTRVRARYVTAVDGSGNPTAWATITRPASPSTDPAVLLYDSIWFQMDLTDLGVLTSGVVTGYADAQLALLTVPQWLSRVTTNSTRLLTKGGLPAYLPSVRAGQMVRLFNVPNTLGGLRNELGLDVVLGEVEYDATNPSEITLAPVGLAVRNLADLASQAKQAADALKQVAA